MPVIPKQRAQPGTSSSALPAPTAATTKPKSRFALQREREAAERAAAAEEDFGNNSRGGGALPTMSNAANLLKLVGNVVERTSTSPPLAPSLPGSEVQSASTRGTGFPASSAAGVFNKPSKSATAELVRGDDENFDSDIGAQSSVAGLLASVSAENDRVLAGMTEAQIMEEQRQIRDSLGLSPGILRMLEERGRQKAQTKSQLESKPVASKTRLAPTGVSVPSSKQRQKLMDDAEDEGSPEYIRRHFFPNEPANPNLAWMTGPSPEEVAESAQEFALTFDINGALLDSATAGPTDAQAGLHHVSSAGSFTIPSLLTLTNSTVPSQRSTSLTVLQRILAHSPSHEAALGPKAWDQLRRDVITRAGWSLKDSHASVVGSALDLVHSVLESELKHPSNIVRDLAPGAEAPPTVLTTFMEASPLSSLASQLAHPVVSPSTLRQAVPILTAIVHLANPFSGGKSDAIESILSTPNLLEAVVRRFIAVAWPAPSAGTSSPLPSAIASLRLLACYSRESAKALWDRKLVEPTLRFISIPPWEMDDATDRDLAYSLACQSFALWEAIGRYGIGTSVRTKGLSLLETFGNRIERAFGEKDAVEDTAVTVPVSLVTSYFQLLSTWTTAAIDPHVTSHDILWTHVEEWGNLAMRVAQWALQRDDKQVGAAAFNLLASWLEGSKVNQSWRGEKQREWVKEQLGAEFESGGRAAKFVEGAGESENHAEAALAVIRLSDAYEEDSNPATPALVTLHPARASDVLEGILSRRTRASTRLTIALLPRLKDSEDHIRFSLRTIKFLRAGDEIAARDLIDRIVNTIAEAQPDSPALQMAGILRPFLTFAIASSNGGRLTGPLNPEPRDIKLTAALYPFASQSPLLAADWPLLPLNELLCSGTSPVFKQLPQGWDATELQIVRSSLALMQAVSAVEPQHRLRAPLLVYDMIKVFMLEKDNTTAGTVNAEVDLFRDEVVQTLMRDLLRPIAIASLPTQRVRGEASVERETMESVSSAVSSAPFYQLYTDLIGLYDSISLSDEIFTLVLLPPLAMSYPIDYRRLLWSDYSHLLKPIKLSVGEAIADRADDGALASYLFPPETNESLLLAYADALGTGKVEPGGLFMELIAVHHVSTAIFDANSSNQILARKLAQAIVVLGKGELTRRLLSYEQVRADGEELRMPPACFVAEDRWKVRRDRLGALVGQEHLDKLL